MSILVNLGLTLAGAVSLLVLFLIQFMASITMPPEINRTVVLVMSGVYLAFAVVNLVRRYRDTGRVVRNGVEAPLDRLPAEPPPRG